MFIRATKSYNTLSSLLMSISLCSMSIRSNMSVDTSAAESDLYTLSGGLPWYVQIPFEFEANFDRRTNHVWLKNNWTLSFYLVAAYLLTLWGLVRWMRERKRFELKAPLVLWNLGLALFSLAATVRTMPEFVRILSHEEGYHKSICDGRTLHSPVALYWGWLFAMSKAWEFGDTIFIVLRKRPLTFLHVFHHCTMLIACWYVGTQVAPTARWFATINYTIHAIMYTYFALHILRWFKIPKWVSMSITALQIAQMVAAGMVNLYAYDVKRRGGRCDQSDGAIRLVMILAVSYFTLFTWFFFNSYIWKGKGAQKVHES